jgi:drug/metabolite transporter (DMT)-like permease
MSGLSNTRILGTTAAIFVAIIWGLSFVAARVVLTTLTPISLATVRFVIATIIYTPFIIRHLNKGIKPSRTELKELFVLGLLSISIYFWLQYTGVQYAGAGISALLVVGLIPVLTGFAGSLLLKESFNVRKGMGIAMGLTGVALIAGPKLFVTSIDWLFFFGVSCLLGNAVCWSIYSTLSRRIIKKTGRPFMVTAWTTLFGTLVLLPMSLTSDWSSVFLVSSTQWISILYLAIICSGGGYYLWNYALSKTEAIKASIWLYLEPVAAFVGEFFLFSVVPSPLTLLGGAGIMVGALLTTFAKE